MPKYLTRLLKPRTLLVSWVVLLISAWGVIPRAQAVDYSVGCDPDAETRTAELIARMQDADASAADDTITLTAGCTYTLAAPFVSGIDTGLPGISNAQFSGRLVIDGSGATVERAAGAAEYFRLFEVYSGGDLTLNNLTVRNGGFADTSSTDFNTGGAIRNNGRLTVNNSTVSDSRASCGGGIWSTRGGVPNEGDGTLIITNSTISGNTASCGGGIFSWGDTTLTGVTISDNHATLESDDFRRVKRGGGMMIESSATVTNSTISDNTAGDAGGGIAGTATLTDSIISGNTAANRGGGAIGTLTLIRSTLSGNHATQGGGFYNEGNNTLWLKYSAVLDNSANRGGGLYGAEAGWTMVENSTIAGNTASVSGGGIYMNEGALNLTGVTVTANSAPTGAGIHTPNGGGDIQNTILAGNVGGADCEMAFFGAEYTLIGDGSCDVLNAPPEWHNLTGDAGLGARTGSPAYYPLLAGSIAIDAGINALIPEGVTTDQVGNDRIQGGIVDLGAVESVFVCMSFPYTVPESSAIALVNAMNCANQVSTDDEITLAGGTYTLSEVENVTDSANALPAIVSAAAGGSLTIHGGGATIQRSNSGTGELRLFAVLDGGDLSIDHVTLRNLFIPSADPYDGGAIHNGNGTVTLANVTFDGSTSTRDGGAIYNTDGTVTITDSTFFGNNVWRDGGAIYNAGGTVTVTNSSFTSNGATYNGGAIRNNGTFTLTDSTLTGNRITSFTDPTAGGAGIYNTGTMTVTGSTISGDPFNSSAAAGGGIWNSGALTLANSTVSDNPAGIGGGMYAAGGTAEVVNSTFTANLSSTLYVAGGSLNLTNSTLINHESGEGVHVEAGSATVANSTITRGAGIVANGGALALNNSIVAYAGSAANCAGAAITVQHSLIQDGSCGVTEGVSGNRTGDPLLGLLLGSPAYYILNAGSPAIDAGDNALIPVGITTDQAGGARVQNGTVDMGSFEYDATSPVLSINDVSQQEGTGEDTTYHFVVSLNAPAPSGGTTFDIATVDGTATAASSDYVPQTLIEASIPEGAASFVIDVTVSGDYDLEDDETFYIDVTNASRATVGKGRGVGTIANDDGPVGFTLAMTTDPWTSEDGLVAEFMLFIASEPKSDVVIELSSSDPGEGIPDPTTITFTPEDWMNGQAVTVLGVDDDIYDHPQPYTVITSAAMSADERYNGIELSDLDFTNFDDDPPPITVEPTCCLTTTEAGGTGTFTVVLQNQPTADVTVGLTSTNTGEGTVDPAALTFTPEDYNTPQTVTVTGVDDAVMDGTQFYLIITQPAVSDDPAYNGLDPDDVTAFNNDNDTPGLDVNPVANLFTSEDGGTAAFTVALFTQPTAKVFVSVSSFSPQEGTVDPAALTFTTGNYNKPQTVTITGVDDLVADGAGFYTVYVSVSSSNDPVYAFNAQPVYLSVINLDNDVAGVTIDPTSGLVTTEAGGTAAFTIVLDTPPIFDVTIPLHSSSTAEGTVSPDAVTFTTADWNVPQTVTVTGVDDAIDDGDTAYTIVTDPVPGGSSDYFNFDADDVSVTNTDDEVALIDVTALKVAADVNGGVTSPGDEIEYTITIGNAGINPAAGVTFTDAIPANTTYVPDSTTLNGSALPDSSGAMPFASGAAVNSPGAPDGQIDAGAQAVVVFRVAVDMPFPDGVTEVSNQGTVSGTDFTDVPTSSGTGGATVTPITRGLAISKAFAPAQIEVGAASDLSFTLANSPDNPALTGLAFTDVLPTGLVFVAPLDTPQCGGTLALADEHSLGFSGGVLGVGEQCSITVTVMADGSAEGQITNVSSILTADGGITSDSGATAVISVGTSEPPPPAPPPATNTPPQTFLCSGSAGRRTITCSGGIQNVHVGGLGGNTYFHPIAEDGVFLGSPAEIGVQSVLDLGVLQAVDVSALLPNGVPATFFDTPVHICMRGRGEALFLNAAHSPRTVERLPTSVEGDYTCVDIPNTGTVVLVRGNSGLSAPPTPAPAATLLNQCQVTTTDAPINLRAEPGTSAAILAKLPYDLTLTATEYVTGWYRVIYLDGQGWLSERFVRALGDCGA